MPNRQAEHDRTLVDYFKLQAEACRQLDSPLTAGLVDHMASDYIARGPVYSLLHDWPTSPVADAIALRMTGALHGAALTGRDVPLMVAYKEANHGQLDMAALWPRARDFLAREPNWVRDYLKYAPQTNEARRSILLLVGFLHLAQQFNMDINMLELGASAGLNMNWDKFRYELDDWSWGPASPVTLSTPWTGPAPPTDAPLRIASRAGCDINSLDLEDETERTRLRSYCWTDVPGRLARLDGAIEIARAEGTQPEKSGAADWLERKLATRPTHGLTVVYHSIFLQYPPQSERERIETLMAQAGAKATSQAPLAWVRFEPETLLSGEPNILEPALETISWPGGQSKILARSNGHVTYVEAN